jgi:Reverse transcriptase (RNA-dependent DNA polymerase)
MILVIAQAKTLLIQQMDVKGAYLNGTLKERVYMHQSEGFKDRTDHICLLKKMLYGLRQSGHEWNNELDRKLYKHGYICLQSDPCTYVQHNQGELAIITVWVNNLLLFAFTDKIMKQIKVNLYSEWQIIDLGELSKIVEIEINCNSHLITILQKLYIEQILKQEGLECANPVGMLLDLKVLLDLSPEGNKGDRSNAFMQTLSALQFIANATRPDIAYMVNKLALYTANLTIQYITALK